jgi:hypothetical protein
MTILLSACPVSGSITTIQHTRETHGCCIGVLEKALWPSSWKRSGSTAWIRSRRSSSRRRFRFRISAWLRQHWPCRMKPADVEKVLVKRRNASSPQWVYDAHLSDQPAYFQRHRWSTATRSRLPAPVRSESGAVPADNGVRPHNRQRIARVRKKLIQTNEYQSVDGAEGEFLWSSPPQNIDLLPQRPNLCLKRCSRADQIDDHPTNKPAKIPHGTTASPDSRSFASQMRFPTGTAHLPRLLTPRRWHLPPLDTVPAEVVLLAIIIAPDGDDTL